MIIVEIMVRASLVTTQGAVGTVVETYGWCQKCGGGHEKVDEGQVLASTVVITNGRAIPNMLHPWCTGSIILSTFGVKTKHGFLLCQQVHTCSKNRAFH